MGYDGVNNYGEEYIAFNPEQIKSSAPVTYDDSGNVIPLSERFNPEEGDIRYSLRGEYNEPITMEDVETLRSIGKKSVNAFNSSDLQKASKWAYKFYQELGTKSPFFRAWFGDWREHSSDTFSLPSIDAKDEPSSGYAVNNDTGRRVSWSKELYNESVLNASTATKSEMRVLATNIDKIVETAILLDSRVSSTEKKRKLPGTAFMHSFYALVPIGQKITLVKMYAEEAFSSKANDVFTRAYTLKQIEKVADFDRGVRPVSGVSDSQSSTEYSIADLYDFVKRFDKDFSPAPAANPALLNEDGTPKVLYHGTDAYEEFYTFKRGKSGWLGPGIYLTSDKGTAQRYADKSGYGGRVYELYAKVENPLVVTGSSPLAEILRAAYGSDRVYNNRTMKQTNEPSMITSADIGKLIRKGYDGIVWEYGKMPIEVSVFNANQVKSATDNIGLFDPENPDIRYSLRTDAELSDREVLGEANDSIAANSKERDYLSRYKSAYSDLVKNKNGLNEQNQIMKDHASAGDARPDDEYMKAKARVGIYEERIKRAETRLNAMEKNEAFARLAESKRRQARTVSEYRSQQRESADAGGRTAVSPRALSVYAVQTAAVPFRREGEKGGRIPTVASLSRNGK